MKSLLLFAAGLFIVNSSIFAGIEKERKWEKTYSINSDARLEMESSFGDIQMETWDKNEIAIEITFIVSGKKEENVMKALEKCTVEASASSSLVQIETRTGDWGNKIEKLETNIKIMAPATISLDLDHRFGDASFPTLKGKVILDIQHGDIRFEGMENQYNEIEIAFGDAILGDINGAVIDAQHSDIKIHSIQGLKLDNQFSDIRIKTLGKKLIADCQHSDIDIMKVEAGFSEINVDIQFGDFNMMIEENASWKLEADLSFSNIELPSGVKKRKSTDGESWSNTYEVRAAHGDTSDVNIEFDAQHSSVSIEFP